MKILIDNGHGVDTPGKRSPDGTLREYAWNREIAGRVVDALTDLGHDAQLLVPEAEDISLSERCRRVNDICRAIGTSNVILVSIHANAAGKGDRWYDATGWCAYTTRGDTRADALATCLYEAAKFHLPGQRLRTDYTDGDPDLEADFYIMRHSLPPAVLVENFFMTEEPTTSSCFLTMDSRESSICTSMVYADTWLRRHRNHPQFLRIPHFPHTEVAGMHKHGYPGR